MKDSALPHISFRTILIASAAAVFTLIALAFVVFQARYLLLGPQLELVDPPAAIQNQRHVTITGNARNISHLWLNDRQIYTDQTGTFTESLILQSGYNLITLRAEDRYGRTKTIEYPITYIPATLAP